MDTLTVDQLLDRAADILERHGWCRHHFHVGSRSCLTGALCLAGRGYTADTAFAGLAPHPASFAMIEAQDALRDQLGRGGLTYWNDQQRDGRKVVRLLRRTARNLRAAGKVHP